MQTSFLLFLGQLLAAVVAISAQVDPSQIPQACVHDCQNLLDLASTCDAEYSSNQSQYATSACLCNAIGTLNYNSCKTCLQTNAPTIGTVIEQIPASCTELRNGCKYECDFSTCESSNVACQCAELYLQNIYDCASCNSAHGHNNATTLSDYNTLRQSCVAQSYTATPSVTEELPTPSGTISYQATDTGKTSTLDGSTSGSATRGQTTGGNSRTTMTAGGDSTGSAIGATSTPTGSTGSAIGPKYHYYFLGLGAAVYFGRLAV